MDHGHEIVFPPASVLLQNDPAPRTMERSLKHKTEEEEQEEGATKAPKRRTSVPKPKPVISPADMNSKTKQTKSRNGCKTCKLKRLKCDEAKPTCAVCLKRNVRCEGYKVDYKWRPFKEGDLNARFALADRTKKEINRRKSPKKCTSSSSSNSPVVPESSEVLSDRSDNENMQKQAHEPEDSGNASKCLLSVHDISSLSSDAGHGPGKDTFADTRPLRSGFMDDNLILHPVAHDTERWVPTFAEFMEPCIDNQMIDLDGFQLPENNLTVQHSASRSHLAGFPSNMSSMRLMSQHRMCARSHSRLDLACSLVRSPVLAPSSPEMILSAFDHDTCGILSIRDGPHENPWRNAILPLVHESDTLYHAIASMTAFHCSKLRPDMREIGIRHRGQCLNSLSNRVLSMPPDLALASTLVLAFAESWDQHVSTGMHFLIGARACMESALSLVRKCGSENALSRRTKFLCNTWVYMDVIARLTSIDGDDNTLFDVAVENPAISDYDALEIDPLMGCASSLFPLVGRVANLIRRVRTTESNSPGVIKEAVKLQKKIEVWKVPQMLNKPEDELCNIEDSIHTAEAYRWATLLYLYQAVPEIASKPACELAQRALDELECVQPSSRTTIIQIYPLLAAGCEASEPRKRSWVVSRWTEMSQRMLIGNVDKCLDITREVWARRDRADAERFMGGQAYGIEDNSLTSCSTDDAWTLLGSADGSMDSAWSQSAFTAESDQLILSSSLPFDTDLDSATGMLHGYVPSAFEGGEEIEKLKMTDNDIFSSLGLPQQDWTSFSEDDCISPSSTMPVQIAEQFSDLVPERTVRGSQHWIGVMQEWKWEVLLG